jgi:hypothetical protein
MTSTLADNSMTSSGQEIAAQISTSAPNSATLRARGHSSGSSTTCSVRQTSRPSSISTNRRRLAASKSGEILPSKIGMATLMTDRASQKPCRIGLDSLLATQPISFQAVTSMRMGRQAGPRNCILRYKERVAYRGVRLKESSAPHSVFGSMSTTWSPSLGCPNRTKADHEVAERTGDDRRFFATDYVSRADDIEYTENSVSPARSESLEETRRTAIAVDQRLPAIAFQ